YSNVGIVMRAGSDVRAPAAGARVFSMKPHMSAYIARANEVLVPIPEGVPADQASLAYLTQLGLAGMRQARYEAGENVMVVGLGVIGLSTVGLARAMGARVVAIGNSHVRCDVALKVGAHAAAMAKDPDAPELLKREFGVNGADLVVLTANPWDAYRFSVENVRPSGRISILGFPGRGQAAPDFNPLDPRWIYAKQLTLLGSGGSPRVECDPGDLRFNLRRNLEYILDLMARGELSLADVISHRLPARRMREAYEMAKEHSKTLVAAVFEWKDSRS
ncbi:MAG: zinc-binding alcohol dehydrogenase, partial [Bryobacteraceae bacterium]